MNQPMQPPAPMAPKTPLITPWLLILFIVVLLGGGGYLGWYFYSQSQAKTETPTTIPTPTTTTPTTTTTTSTADWKTYTNDTYGLSVKYPSKWKATESNQTLAPINGKEIVELSNAIGDIDIEEGMNVSIYYSTDLTKYPDINQLLSSETNQNSQDTNTTKKISPNGFEGVITRAKPGDRTYMEDAQLFKKTSSGFVEIRWSSTDPNEKGYTFENYAAQILSTFQFTK